MKKEKKKITKKDINEKKKFSEKKDDNKILDELAVSLKKLSDEGEKDKEKLSELEEDVELNLDDFEFHNFIRGSDESSAPVLERIAGSQAGPIFVGGISQSQNTIPGEEKELDPFKYVPGQNANGEPKYIDSDSHIRAAAERIDFAKAGREGTGFEPWKINQEAMFMQSPEAKFESQFQEKVWNAERFDEDRERERRRKNPLEPETKYEKYKPDLPKSR